MTSMITILDWIEIEIQWIFCASLWRSQRDQENCSVIEGTADLWSVDNWHDDDDDDDDVYEVL